jgi:hypothetical protein
MPSITKYAKLWTGLLVLLAVPACSSQPNLPPMAAVTELGATARPAKGPDCYMPVLSAEPAVDFQKIAIVDGWGSLGQSRSAVLDVVKRKACETGADALVVLDAATQDKRKLVYEGAPNPMRGSQTADQAPGDYLLDREQVPAIGSVGHPGIYVDAVAIIYIKPESRN